MTARSPFSCHQSWGHAPPSDLHGENDARLPETVSDDRSDSLEAALHDVSNALTSVLGWLELIRTKQVESVEDALRAAESQARQAYRIARGTLRGSVPPASSEAVASVIDAVRNAAAPAARRRKVELRFEPGRPDDIDVPSPDALTQILVNLALNAVEHTPESSMVTVSHGTSAASLDWIVEDEGPGVPESVRAKLFTASVSTREGGAGVGLKHAHALAAACGGRLAYDPAPRGARFVLRWPLEAPRKTTPAALGGRHIVLYDDDTSILELLRTALEARGASVALATSATELDHHLQRGSCDIVVADLSPIGDGVETFCRMVRATRPECRLIFMSGRVDGPPPVVRGVPWLQKPFELSEFERVVVEGR